MRTDSTENYICIWRRWALLNKFDGLLEQIEQCLAQFNMPVYYGRSFAKANDDWNYIVFNRQLINKTGTSRCDINYQYQVHIIMENYIDEGFEIQVIKALQDDVRLKLTGQGQFNYVTKGQTDTVVEMLTLTFTRTSKGFEL